MKPKSDQEENELVILHLRQLCESKQKSHVHIGEAPQVLREAFDGVYVGVYVSQEQSITSDLQLESRF